MGRGLAFWLATHVGHGSPLVVCQRPNAIPAFL